MLNQQLWEGCLRWLWDLRTEGLSAASDGLLSPHLGRRKASHQKGNIDRACVPGVPDSKRFELFRGGRDYCGHRWFRKSSTGVLDLKDPLDMYVSLSQFAGQKK